MYAEEWTGWQCLQLAYLASSSLSPRSVCMNQCMRMCAAWIVVISIIIIACLFLIQQFGTGLCGQPVLARHHRLVCLQHVINLYNIIVYQPSVFRAIGECLGDAIHLSSTPHRADVRGACCKLQTACSGHRCRELAVVCAAGPIIGLPSSFAMAPRAGTTSAAWCSASAGTRSACSPIYRPSCISDLVLPCESPLHSAHTWLY